MTNTRIKVWKSLASLAINLQAKSPVTMLPSQVSVPPTMGWHSHWWRSLTLTATRLTRSSNGSNLKELVSSGSLESRFGFMFWERSTTDVIDSGTLRNSLSTRMAMSLVAGRVLQHQRSLKQKLLKSFEWCIEVWSWSTCWQIFLMEIINTPSYQRVRIHNTHKAWMYDERKRIIVNCQSKTHLLYTSCLLQNDTFFQYPHLYNSQASCALKGHFDPKQVLF